jgi:serine/threonine protein kinase/tetratricopeptide (TPR) repeat protein
METLGKYGFLEKLSNGSLGAVYKAFDPSGKRHVMIRTIGAGLQWAPESKERFSAECAAIAGLRHPSIAAVYEQAEEGEITYIVMELLAGKDLKSLIAENAPMTIEEKLAVMIQVAAGLNQAHAHGILHRTLQPGNIHILPDGTAKITDFDIGSLLTAAGPLPGMQQPPDTYLAPEQVLGKSATCQSDVFRVGLIFYEFLTGTHPFHAGDSDSILDNILNQSSFPTVEQFPAIPLGLWPILEKCLAKDVEERYASMDEVVVACRGVLEELAEDSELIRIELQTALPRLRQAVRRPGAPRALAQLQSDVETALLGSDKPDYSFLNRLLTAVAEQYYLLHGPQAVPGATLNQLGEIQPENDTSAADAFRVMEETPAEPPQEREPDVPSPAGKGVPPIHDSPAPPLFAESTPGLRAAPTDRISELIRDIDEGQERIQQTVESFLAKRQARGAGGESIPEKIHGAASASSVDPPQPSPHEREAPSAAADARLTPDQPQQRFRQAGPGRTPMYPPTIPSRNTEDAPGAPLRRDLWRTTLWIGAAAILLTLALAVPLWINGRSGSTAGGAGAAPVRIGGGSAGTSGASESSDPIASAIRDRLNFARRDILLEEAQVLRAVGRRDESKVFLNRLLEIYPAYQPAIEELSRIEAETSPPKDKSEAIPSAMVQKLLASAASAIRTGKLQKAKADIDKADQLQPGLAEVGTLRKRLEAKNAEAAQNLAREQAKQEAAQKQKAAESLTRRTEDLYRQAKYDEALSILEEQLSQDPQWLHAQDLRNRTLELQRNLKAYEAALNAGKNADALAALEKVERISPSDPNLPALRKRAEVRPVQGSASLSLYPLGESASLMLDDQPAGANGELINQTISAGKHKVTARNGLGFEVALLHDFSNGQKVFMVYDVARQVMRPMTEADRELMNRNKAKQQVHRFNVEHIHGLFRGSCRGELLVSYFDVVYRPITGSHGFNIPFKTLKVRVEEKNVVLVFAMDSREFSSFKVQDSQTALSIRNLWDDLSSLDR